jgi:hypothetical protein
LHVPLVVVVVLLTLSVPAIVCPDERTARAITIRDIQMYLPVSFETGNKGCLRFIGNSPCSTSFRRSRIVIPSSMGTQQFSPAGVVIISIKRSTLEKLSTLERLCGFKGSKTGYRVREFYSFSCLLRINTDRKSLRESTGEGADATRSP